MTSIYQGRLKTSQLRALVAIAEYGKFGEAALQLEISQSGISHAISTLEDELGVSLLVRHHQHTRCTPVGKEIVQQARQILQLLEQIEEKANQAKGLNGGIVRVASFRSAATYLLPKAIAQFRSKFPDISIRLTEHNDYKDVEQMLYSNDADIGLTYLPTTDKLETWEIYRDEYLVLLPPTFKSSESQLTWEQLCSYPLIMLPESHSCCARIHTHCRSFGQKLNVILTTNEDSTQVNMVAQGLGATIMPRLAAEPIPDNIKVCGLPIPLTRVIGVAVLANALQTPAVFAFLETFQQVKFAPSRNSKN
ncbi:putative HTH-type transcriptional regulator LrrA [Hyella patelloides LEGE 07179]|uniref:Putative HTH-type transcriptional regulator LrrA n=1 Tax=Hyella patelloides LEGE 07179 TaxID=945734 RepID=A0A563VKK3_9CYAN|nr:LysR family transcriptional regulator [Hyella patelloides]VEP11835.1 putative HTH-type transcriptional regulator LrrA [Hyella patelloides LEGE 07179]